MKMVLQVLFWVFLLSWPMIVLAQSPLITKPGCQSTCGNVLIPFPFGIGPGCYMDEWFVIDCNSSKPFIRTINLEVLEISVEKGTVRVNHSVFESCSDLNYFMSSTNLEESPFVFSQKENRFIGLGCNNLAYMRSNKSIICGCFSMCDRGVMTAENACNGLKCCQTIISSSFQVFNATVASINYNEKRDTGQKECKYAFLVDRHWFETDLTNPQAVMHMSHVPVVLAWGIFNYSFNQFAADKRSAYKWTSECEVSHENITSSTNIASSSTTQYSVVQCSCKSGYEGNPYLLQGCTDIDECKNSNFCPGMVCENYIGGSYCFTKKSKINVVALGFGTGLGGLFLFIGAWWLSIIIKRKKAIKRKEKFFKQNGGLLLQQQLTSSDGTVDKSKLFNSKELGKATDHFNVNRILGQGGQGTVYKGMLADGRIVAVKKFKVVDEGKVQEFINEVTILSQINHRNVVKLLGCCLETEVPLLVYEFIPNGTLFQYLHDQNEEFPLTWDKRLQIATEIAGALSYLHSGISQPIYHRDIKSTNILLDEKYRAKIADFGTSRSIAIDQTHVTTKVQGTFGYLDPEYFQSSQFTDKSDVYSFGVVLVELLTGQTPISSKKSEEVRSLIAYFIISMEENRLHDVLDAQVPRQGKMDEVMVVANLAKRCLNLNGKRRPTMKEVSMELEGIRALQKDSNVQQTHQEIEYERTEACEAWDFASTSTSTFDHTSPSLDVHPLLINTSS